MTLSLLPEQSISDVNSLFTLKFGAQARIAALSDGRIAAVWSEPVGDKNVHLRLFAADGSPLGASSVVNPPATGYAHAEPQVTALADGGFAVIWQRQLLNGEDNIFARAYDAAGAPRSEGFIVTPDGGNVSSTEDDDQYGDVLGLADGGAIIVWQARGPNDTFARVLGADGITLGDPVQIFTSGEDATMIQLANGDVLIADETYSNTGVTIRLSGPDLVSAPAGRAGATGPVVLDIDLTPDEHGTITGLAPDFLVPLAAGGFAMGYRYDDDIRYDTPIDRFRLDRYDAAGALLGRVDLPFPAPAGGEEYSIGKVVALEGDRLLVIWEVAVASGDFDLLAQLLDANGTSLMDPQALSTHSAQAQRILEAKVLADGNVAVSFLDGSNAAVEGGIDPLHLRVIEIPPAPVSTTPTEAADDLTGTAAADAIDALGGNDTVAGLGGDDTLTGGAGDDSLDGGADHDEIYGNQGADTLLGGGGDDRLDGGLDADSVSGGAGNDTVIGGGGFDTLRGGAGDDTVNGGDGRDLAYLGGGNDLFIDNAQGGVNGRDTVYANAGNDTVGGGNGDDVFWGQDGNDRLLGRLGNDKLFGGNQNDTMVGGDGNDTVAGGNGRDRAFMGNGNDTWFDNDQVAFGDDSVVGGNGNDTIRMGGGNDTASGGAGADQFVFAAAINADVISDYQTGTDALHIDATLWGGALDQTRLDALSDTSSGDLVLDFGGGHSITFAGLTDNTGLLGDIVLV